MNNTLNLLLSNIDKFYKLENKDFASNCAILLKYLTPRDEQIEVLCDLQLLNNTLKGTNAYCYPILVEFVPGVPLNQLTHVKGFRRYYDDIFTIKNKKYFISNDWYYENEVGSKENRTCFINYIKQIASIN